MYARCIPRETRQEVPNGMEGEIDSCVYIGIFRDSRGFCVLLCVLLGGNELI